MPVLALPIHKAAVLTGQDRYLLRDEFDNALSAGAVNGTQATPGPGTRTVVDAESKLSIASGKLTFSGGKASPAVGDPQYRMGAITRKAGRMLLSNFSSSDTGAKYSLVGWSSTATPTLFSHFEPLLTFAGGATGSFATVGTAPAIGTYATNGTAYPVAVVQRAAGGFILVKISGQWRLLWVSSTGSTATLYPTIDSYSMACSFDNLRVPDALWLPVPLASDSFNRADGVMGNTNGAGHAEANGGGGLAWTEQAGTWGIATNKAACSATAGGLGLATVAVSSADVLVELGVTRTAGNAGILLRYQDASNYVYAYTDATNCALVERASDIETTRITGAVTYAAGARMQVWLAGADARLYYNNALVGSYASTILTGAKIHGMYTTDTGNSFDNAVCWPVGTGSEHSALNRWSQ